MLLALAATRAAAQDGDFDDAGPSERGGVEVDGVEADEDVGDALGGSMSADTVRSHSWLSTNGDATNAVTSRSDSWLRTNSDRLGDDTTADMTRSRSGPMRTNGDARGDDTNADTRPLRSWLVTSLRSVRAADDGAGTTLAANRDLAGLVVDGAPPMSSVIDATVRAAGLAEDPVPGWRTRSRWSALVPAVTSRVGNSESWREVTDPTVSRALSYDVRVSWRLERLIYDPNEPRFATFDISRRRERRRLIAIATHAYLAWLRARTELIDAANELDDGETLRRDAPGSTQTGRRILIEAHQLQVELDALTDGWFSHALAAPTRSR